MTSSNLKIKITDLVDQAYAIASSLPDYFNENGLKDIKTALQNEKFYGVFLDDHLVGFATYQEVNQKVIELTWMAVSATNQSKGIGTELITKSLDELATDYEVCKVKTLASQVSDEGYEKTRSFYQKLGFLEIETIDPYPGWDPGNPCLIMIKILNNFKKETK